LNNQSRLAGSAQKQDAVKRFFRKPAAQALKQATFNPPEPQSLFVRHTYQRD